MKTLFVILLAVLCFNAFGQTHFSIQFNFNSDQLTPEMERYIESQIAPVYNSTRKYEVNIKGHTDSIGSKRYNQSLSERRANAVAKFLAAHGLVVKEKKGLNYSKPVEGNKEESGRVKNRRVEVEIIPIEKNLLTINSQQYTFKAEEGGKFYYKRSGSLIIIPDHAILKKDGSEVKGEVTLKYEEYRDAADFISSGITMRYDSSGTPYYFNSGGMFKIQAYQNGEELALAKGKRIQMGFVLTDTLPDMNFYQMNQEGHHWDFQHDLSGREINGGRRNGGDLQNDLNEKLNSCKLNISLLCNGDTLTGVTSAIDQGMKYAYSGDSINPVMGVDLMPFRDRFSSNKYAGVYLLSDNKIEEDKKYPLYFEVQKRKGRKSIVKIKDKTGEHTELAAFKDLLWEYDSKNNPSLKEKLFTQKWSDLRISNTLLNGSVVLELKNESKTFHLVFHPIYLKQKVLKKARGDRAQLLKVDYNNGLDRREQIFQDSLVDLKIQAERYFRMNECFHNYSKITMPMAERCKDLYEWFRYFNKHKDIMKQRYFSWDSTVKSMNKNVYMDQLRNYLKDLRTKAIQLKPGDELLEETEEERIQRVKDDFETLRQISKMTIENQKQRDPNAKGVIPGMIQALYLDGFGVFNCDRTILLGKPVYVRATFKNKSGKVIEGRVVSLVDKNINSVLSYDPNNFAYNPQSRNVLVLFDINDRKYVLKEEEMKKLTSLNNEAIVIVIEDVTEQVKSSADLKRVMGI